MRMVSGFLVWMIVISFSHAQYVREGGMESKHGLSEDRLLSEGVVRDYLEEVDQGSGKRRLVLWLREDRIDRCWEITLIGIRASIVWNVLVLYPNTHFEFYGEHCSSVEYISYKR